MSNEAIIPTIETIKKKLKKYIALKEQQKIKEYLHKLYKISLTPTIIQETKIDKLIRYIASNKTASYHSLAKHLLKKWYHKKLISRSTKLKPTVNTTSTIIESQTNDERRGSNDLSESQLSNDNKKRKVLSLAQYLENKRPVLSPLLTVNSIQNKLTDTQIQIINAQFKATTEKLAASAPNLTKIIDKNLIETDKTSNNRIEVLVKKPVVQQPKTKFHDLWIEEEEDEDDLSSQS